MGKFEQDIEVGKIGEKVAKEILLKSPKTISVIDCSNDKFFQKLDIDLLVETTDGLVLKYEIKTDTMANITGNLVWEDTTSGNIGCFEKTRADYMLYYLLETDELFGFWIKSMRKYVHNNKRYLKKVKMGDNATGYLINIEDLISKKLIKEIRR